MSRSERVRVYTPTKSITQYRRRGLLRFTWAGVVYARRRRRDAIGLPVFEAVS